MSWFDTTGFSSFAKNALSQAQNLQKSIDRVLDIEDGSSGTTAARSQASATGSSDKKNSTGDKSSSLSSTSKAVKSSRKTSPDGGNVNDSNSEGNSFWSSFLGESFSGTTTTTAVESKASNTRTSGRKLGSRTGGTPTTGKRRATRERREPVSANVSPEKENSRSDTVSPRALNQDKKFNDEVSKTTQIESQALNTSASPEDLEGPRIVGDNSRNHTSRSVVDRNASVGNLKHDADGVISTSCSTQKSELVQTVVGNNLSSKQSVLSHVENSAANLKNVSLSGDEDLPIQDGKKDTQSAVLEVQTSALLQDTQAEEICDSHIKRNSYHLESVLAAGSNSQSHAVESVGSTTTGTSLNELQKVVSHAEEPIKDTESDAFVVEQCGEEKHPQNGENFVSDCMSSDGNGSLNVRSVADVFINNEFNKESQHVATSEHREFFEVEPLACSTPHRRGKPASAALNQEMEAFSEANQDGKTASVLPNQETACATPVLPNLETETSLSDNQGEKTASVLLNEEIACSTPNHDAATTSVLPNQETEAEEHLSQPADEPVAMNQVQDLLHLEVADSGTKLHVHDQTEEVKAKTLTETNSQEESLAENQNMVQDVKSDDGKILMELHVENKETGVLEIKAGEKVPMRSTDKSVDSTDDLRRQIEELQNEVTGLKQVVEVRETKLIHLSKENIDLQEATSILRNQLEQAESAMKAEDEEIDEVRQEFTVRVVAAEKKIHAATKERDEMKELLEQTKQSLNSRNDRQSEEFSTLLKEKDDQIAQLLEEGEKLSKQQLQSNNIIKKLRAKEKESEALITKNSKTLEDVKSENTRLTEILQVREDTEKKQGDAITKLNTFVQKQDEQVSKQKSDLDDAAEKIRSMQTALDNAYKQLADLHKANASKDSVAQEAALSAEMKGKEELRIAMEKKERQFKREIEGLEFQISDLQTSLRRAEQQSSRREDNLRQEVSDVQQRLQEAEARNQELTESVTYATRPLLRQIENLQSSYGNQTATWERVEKNLTERLNDAQMQLVEAQEKERVATDHALELTSRLASVESQLSTYRQDKSRLEAALEVERTRLEGAEEGRSRESAKLETLQSKYRKMVEDSNVEKTMLEQQLAVERGKMETEKKKLQNAMDEKERLLIRQTSFSGAPSSPSAREELLQDELPEASPHRTLVRQSSSKSIVDGFSRGLVMSAGTALVERLQAQVKQKDGEIELLQEQLTVLEKTRDSVTEELTSLTSKLETIEEDSRLLEELKVKHKELVQRHNAVLQMYGEKAEEAEELRMDLEDVKSMYKSQIQELLGASRR